MQGAGRGRNRRQRTVDEPEIRHDQQEGADGDAAVDDVHPADAEHRGRPDEGDRGDEEREHRLMTGELEPRVRRLGCGALEAPHLVVLPREGLHQPDRGEALVDARDDG